MTFCNLQIKYFKYIPKIFEKTVTKILTKGAPMTPYFVNIPWGITFMDFVGFLFRTSKLKNDTSYIKYKYSHRFAKVCR